MKVLVLTISMLAAITTIWLTTPRSAKQPAINAAAYISSKKLTANACAPDRSDPTLLPDNPGDMIPLPGWGKYRWTAVSPVDSAQFYFDQGINMYYSFHIVESLSSFQKAAYLDPASAMAYWGIALAYGPNINDVVYNYSPLALDAARKANSLSKNLGPFERGLIRAMLARYSDNASISRVDLDEAYTREMKKLYDQFSGNPDAGALYADALMLMHPWDLYDQRQKPKPWTPELVSTIEKVLSSAPDHPGANHYYIHAVEASTNPGRALSSADKLGSLLPSVAHMVHMPSHIYIRTGNYAKGIAVNKQAIKGYQTYRSLMPGVENGAFLYLMHNLHMQATNAMSIGQYSESVLASDDLKASIPMDYLTGPPPEAEYMQYMYLTNLFTEIRFGKWEKILALPAYPDSLYFARLLREFGRSIAFSRTGNYGEAKSAISTMEHILAISEQRLKRRMGAFNTAYAAGEVAIALATGILAEEEKRWDVAITQLQRAVTLEDNMIYNEPKDWLLPPRQYLGAALLKSGNYNRAEIIFREDLGFNPNNGWSLKGLEMALKAQNKGDAWKKAETESRKSRDNKDFNPNGPVF